MSVWDHRKRSAAKLKYSVLVVSTSKYSDPSEDRTGDLATELIKANGDKFVEKKICPDDIEMIRSLVLEMSSKSDVVLVCGGTGLHPQDLTVEALRPLFSKELPGFGEIFRWLSYQEVGPAAMLSRATAGVIGKSLVFLLPGSPEAVKLALEKIILTEASHGIWTVRGYKHMR